MKLTRTFYFTHFIYLYTDEQYSPELMYSQKINKMKGKISQSFELLFGRPQHNKKVGRQCSGKLVKSLSDDQL